MEKTSAPSRRPWGSTSKLWSTKGEARVFCPFSERRNCQQLIRSYLVCQFAGLFRVHGLQLRSKLCVFSRFKLNIWDVGGQKSLRSYWRNYFESTDGLVWVVDSADRLRLQDCRQELSALLLEEVLIHTCVETRRAFLLLLFFFYCCITRVLPFLQRLAGATLLVFANKQDLPGALSKEAIQEVIFTPPHLPMIDFYSFIHKMSWQHVLSPFLLQALALDEIKSHHWCIISCSAVTGDNLLTGVDWLLDDIAARIFTADWVWRDLFPSPYSLFIL